MVVITSPDLLDICLGVFILILEVLGLGGECAQTAWSASLTLLHAQSIQRYTCIYSYRLLLFACQPTPTVRPAASHSVVMCKLSLDFNAYSSTPPVFKGSNPFKSIRIHLLWILLDFLQRFKQFLSLSGSNKSKQILLLFSHCFLKIKYCWKFPVLISF